MSKIPSASENPKGLHHRYVVASKVSGEAVDPRAEYFVLRVDKYGDDPRHINCCRAAILVYAKEIEPFMPELAADIFERYSQVVPFAGESK